MNRLLLLVLVPLGILCAYELVMRLAEIKRTGCGTHGFLEAYHFYEGFASLRDTAVKAAASALTIGFGGSAGLEGPSLTIGGGIASAIARLLRVPEEEVPRLFLAGGAAGLAAIFRTPLTGLLFALEIPYKRDLEKDVFVQAMLASVTSYLVFVAICGTETLFTLYPGILELTPTSVLNAAMLGLLTGALGRAFVALYEWLREKLAAMGESRIRWALPLLGGLAVAAIGLLEPRALGVGYETIHDSLLGKIGPLDLAILAVLKIVVTSLTLNSGGSGGLFIPSIYVGAVVGALFSHFAGGPVEIYAMAGMASVLAATSKTLLTAVAFTAETAGPSSVIQTLIAATISYFSSGLASFYEVQPVKRPRGDVQLLRELLYRLHRRYPELLERLRANDLMIRPPVVLRGNLRIREAIELAKESPLNYIPVVSDHKLQGFVTLEDLLAFTERSRDLPVAFVHTRPGLLFRPSDTLERVLERVLEEGAEEAAVVDEEGKLLGLVTVRSILKSVVPYIIR